MRWLVDECLPHSLVLELRNAGHDVVYVAESARQTDDALLAHLAMREERLILTEDKEFGSDTFRKRKTVPGMVLIRIPHEHRATTWPRLRDVIEHFGDSLYGSYVVLDEVRFRARSLK